MRPTESIERLLSETPVPGLKDGLHRAALKRELLSQMQTKGRRIAEEPRHSGGDLSLATRTKAVAAHHAAAMDCRRRQWLQLSPRSLWSSRLLTERSSRRRSRRM